MQLIFDSLDELRAFVAELDGDDDGAAAGTAPATTGRRRRRTKEEMAAASAQQAAVPAAPAATGFGPPPGAAPAATGFPSAAPAAAPAVPQANPLVQAIIGKTEQAIAAGQPLDAVVGWYRTALGPETAQANWEQIKTAFLPKAADPLLKQIAAQLGVQG